MVATGTLLASLAAGAAGSLLPRGRPRRPRARPVDDGPGHDPPVLRWVATVGVGLGVLFLVGGTVGWPASSVAAATTWWLTGRLEPSSVRRRRERLAAAVPHAVDLMAACLSAGLSPAGALDEVAAALDEPLAGELSALSARLRMGVDPTTVWLDLAGHPQLGGLGRTVSRAVDTGASVAEAMLRLADDLRRAGRAEVESRARSVGVKAALPLGACLLPAFVLVGVVPLVAGSVAVLLP